MSAILAVEGLSVSYGSTAAVIDSSFDVQRGEIVALVGESGSGKSTTVQTLVGLLPDSARVSSGRVLVDGTDIVGLSEKALRRVIGSRIGYVPQDPTVSLDPVKSIGAQIAEVFRVHGGDRREAARLKAIGVLERVGFDRPQDRYGQYPHEISGGMRQRVLIGIALAANPRLIVADEPTSGLDVTVQKTILDELTQLARSENVAVLLVTHDLGVAHDRADRIIVMEQGRVVETAATAELFATPQHPYTRRLLAAVPALSPLRARREEHRRQEREREEARERDGVTTPFLEVADVSREFRLRGARERLIAVDDVSLSLDAGRTLGIVGESGSGKSTLARIIADLTPASSGEVHLEASTLSSLNPAARRERRRRVQYVYQNPFSSLDPRFTLERIIAEPLTAFGVGDRASRRAEVARLLDLVALPAAFASRTPVELSGGQRQRVAIARALALSPRLLVLDEPVSALDVSVQEQVLELLVELQEQLGLAYVFISHDLAVVRLLADRTAVIQRGRVVEEGPTERIFTDPHHDYTRSLLAAIPGPALSIPALNNPGLNNPALNILEKHA
ncbi:ABC transporter ATP-binding protein [Microbacteriaceae bacterium VKM Ac-2854]|nr:ABC transporter ATP-binding protein [Microbacteriaceae bacterium VKM Ac-2854]